MHKYRNNCAFRGQFRSDVPVGNFCGKLFQRVYGQSTFAEEQMDRPNGKQSEECVGHCRQLTINMQVTFSKQCIIAVCDNGPSFIHSDRYLCCHDSVRSLSPRPRQTVLRTISLSGVWEHCVFSCPPYPIFLTVVKMKFRTVHKVTRYAEDRLGSTCN